MRYITKFFTLSLSTFFSLSLLALTALLGLYLLYSPQLPDSSDLRQIELQVPLRIYSRDEQLIAEYGAKRRRPVTFEQIPVRLRQAFIAIEDARYYEHQGIDLKSVARAAYSLLANRRFTQGASTITMQLARNAFLGREKTLERKLKETLLAFKLERTLSKNEILELYLNKIYLGKRAYGIAAAAKTYYGKDELADLSLAQMAMIAGLPKAPSRYNPIANPERAMIRRDYILKRMFMLGYINQAEYDSAFTEENTARIHKTEIEAYAPYLAEMVRATIVKQYQSDAYTQGLHVYTTLDAGIQQQTASTLRKSLIAYDQRHGYRGPEDHIDLNTLNSQEEWLDKLADHRKVADMEAALVVKVDHQQAELLMLNEQMDGEAIRIELAAMSWARPYITVDRQGRKPNKVSSVLSPGDIVRVRKIEVDNNTQAAPWQLAQIPKVNGALLVMDPENGAIRSIMGGFDYYQSKFNRVTQAMRQPGSSFKPIVYAAALERGYTPTSIVNDAPITVPGSKWQPKNFGGKYVGPTSIAEALAKSRNLVAIRLLRNTGISHVIDYAMRFGYKRENLPPNLTLALGTGITTPLQMATAYSSFANGGFKVDAHFIQRIEDNNGGVLYNASGNTKHACGDNLTHCPTTPIAANEDGNPVNYTATNDTATSQPTLPAAPRIMSARAHTQIVSMMQGVTRFGTAVHAGRTLKRKDIAGKTGTTNDQKDSWFCGFTPEYVAVAWAGFDNMAELGDKETSTKITVPMWTDLMKTLLHERPEKPWPTYNQGLQQAKMENNLPPLNTGGAEIEANFEMTVTEEVNTAVNAELATTQQTAQDTPPVTELRTESVEIPEQLF